MPDPHHPQDVPETPIAPFKLPDNPTTTPSTGIARTGQILGFLLKYRRAGVFAGLDGDLGEAPAVQSDSEAGPEAFVDEQYAHGGGGRITTRATDRVARDLGGTISAVGIRLDQAVDLVMGVGVEVH